MVVALPSCLRRLLPAKTHVEKNVIIDVVVNKEQRFSVYQQTIVSADALNAPAKNRYVQGLRLIIHFSSPGVHAWETEDD